MEENQCFSIQKSSTFECLYIEKSMKEIRLVVTAKPFVSRDESKLFAHFRMSDNSEILSKKQKMIFEFVFPTTIVNCSI